MGIGDFFLGRKSGKWYHRELDDLLRKRHRYEAILEHIKAQLGKNSFKLDWSDDQYRKEWGKYYGGVQPIILESHHKEWEQGLREIKLVEEARQVRKKLEEINKQISRLIAEMRQYGYHY